MSDSGCCGGEAIAATAIREAIAAEARSWIGTRFVNGQAVKGAGVDCGGLLVSVYAAVGFTAMQAHASALGPHSRDWFLHREGPDYYREYIERYADRIDMPQMGDFALFYRGRKLGHSAICVENPRGELYLSRWVEVDHAVREMIWNHQMADALEAFYRPKELR